MNCDNLTYTEMIHQALAFMKTYLENKSLFADGQTLEITMSTNLLDGDFVTDIDGKTRALSDVEFNSAVVNDSSVYLNGYDYTDKKHFKIAVSSFSPNDIPKVASQIVYNN